MLPPGNVGISHEHEARHALRRLADADPRRHQNLTSVKAVLLDLQRGLRRGQIRAIVSLTGDTKGLTQAARSGS